MDLLAGRRYQYRSARDPKDAVPQNQNRRYQRPTSGSHPSHSQQRVYVVPIQECYARGLEAMAISYEANKHGMYHCCFANRQHDEIFSCILCESSICKG